MKPCKVAAQSVAAAAFVVGLADVPETELLIGVAVRRCMESMF